MAVFLTKEFIEHSKMVENLKKASEEATKLCDVVEDFLAGKTTRSQLNKEIKKVRHMVSLCGK